MTEKIVSGHVQTLPTPLSLDNLSALQPALSEDGMKSNLPQFKTKKRPDNNSTHSMSPFPKEAHPEKEESINLQPVTVKISEYGMLSEKLICPDASMPGHLDEMDRRKAGLEEPQLAREASLGDSQRPVESAKTPDMSLFAALPYPPHLEPEDLGEHEAEGEMCGTEDNSSLQLPVLQPEEIYVLRDAEIGEESVPPILTTHITDEHTNVGVASPDEYCSSDEVACEEQKHGTVSSTKSLSSVPDFLKKTPVVLLTRLSPEVLDSCKRHLPAAGTKTEDSHDKPLTVRVDQGGVEFGNDDQSKKTKTYNMRSKVQERLSPLNQMLKLSSMWSKCSTANTVSLDSASDMQLDENSNSEPGKSGYSASIAVNSKDSSVSKTLQPICSSGKDVLKKRHVISDPSLIPAKCADETALEEPQTAVQDPQLLQMCTEDSESNHSLGQLSRYGVGKYKQQNLPGRHSKDFPAAPTSYTTYSPGDLKMTFISCSKLSVKGGNKGGCDGLETGRARSSSKEPPVDGWESCPDVIFDCSSQGRSALLKTANDVSRNATTIERTMGDSHESWRDSSDLGLEPPSHPDNFLEIANNQPARTCSDQDETVTSTYNTQLSLEGEDRDDSISLLRSSESTAVPSNAAHGNAAESASSFVPSSSSQDILNQTAAQGSISSRGNKMGKHSTVSGLEPGRVRGTKTKGITGRVLDDQSRELVPSSSESHKNGLNRPPSSQAVPSGTHVKMVKNGLKPTLQAKRLPSKKIPTSSGCSMPPPYIRPHNGHKTMRYENRKDQSLNSMQAKNTAAAGRVVSFHGSGPPRMSVMTVHINGENATGDSTDECVINCIEKTSPPFIIPHQDEKMVESDMVVMQNYYYNTLCATSQLTTTTVSGCCQKSAGDTAVRASTSSYSAGSSQALTASESGQLEMPTLIQFGEDYTESKHDLCFSSQSHLVNTGILMVNPSATKTLPIKISPGRKRTNFRSVSEDSEKTETEHAEYKDVNLSSIVVDEKGFNTQAVTSDFGSYTITLATDSGAHDDDDDEDGQEQSCNAQAAAEAEQCHYGNFEVTGECDSTADQQNGHASTMMHNRGASMEDMMTMDEDMLLQNFEGEIMGQVQIRQENDEFDEVFDIVNERDVPIPHEAFLHSLSLLRNTELGNSSCETSQQSKKAALSSFSLAFFHDGMGDHERCDYDSDATLPYPRDEIRQNSKRSNKPRKQRRSKKKRRKPSRTTTTTIKPFLPPAIPVTSTKKEPTSKKSKDRSVTKTKLIELPVSASPKISKREEKSQTRKKSSNRHPLFKQRHQAATRRPKPDKAKTFKAKPTTPTASPTKTTPPGTATKTDTSSPATSPTAKGTTFLRGVSIKSSEYESIPPPDGSLPKDLAGTQTKSGQLRQTVSASGQVRSGMVKTIANRVTIAINALPGKPAVKLVSRGQKGGKEGGGGGGKRKWKAVAGNGELPEAVCAGEERAGGCFEGTRLTDESEAKSRAAVPL